MEGSSIRKNISLDNKASPEQNKDNFNYSSFVSLSTTKIVLGYSCSCPTIGTKETTQKQINILRGSLA